MNVLRWLAYVGFCGLVLAVCPGCVLDAQPRAEGTFDRTLTVTGPVDLDLRTGSGSVDIKTGPVDSVHVTGRIRAGSSWLLRDDPERRVQQIASAPPIQQTGNTIRVGHVEDQDLFRNVGISYEVTVPEATRVRSVTGSGGQTIERLRGPVDVVTGSGRIRLGEIGNDVTATTGSGSIDVDRAAGSVSARTGSGSIRATGVGGPVAADTGSGRIDVAQTSAADVDVTTGSGGISLSGARGAVRARTGSGGISVEGAPLKPWDVQTSSGTITMRVVGDTPFDLDARSSSGRVETSDPITVSGSISRQRVRGTVRGGGARVDLSTGSGSIRIQ
jgi:putative adhesin